MIPSKMKALLQREEGGRIELTEVDVPKPKNGEVLVKMAFSPINPSDLAMLEGSFTEKPSYPLIPGIEGSGKVVASGGGFIANLRKGKRVAITSTKGLGGVWSEYVCTSAMHCIPLDKHIDDQQGAFLIVNPLTALAFIDLAKQKQQKAIVNTAAASALGKMLLRMAKKEGIEVVHIVRREEQKQDLMNLGAKHVLNSEENNFDQEFEKICKTLNIQLIFDAVSGSLAPRLLNAAPDNSTLFLYAKLDAEPMLIDQRQIVQRGKEIKGFFLGKYSGEKSILKSLKDIKRVKQAMGKEIVTPIAGVYSPMDFQKAFDNYTNNMSKGKVLLGFEV